jgi:hypothetical protein
METVHRGPSHILGIRQARLMSRRGLTLIKEVIRYLAQSEQQDFIDIYIL